MTDVMSDESSFFDRAQALWHSWTWMSEWLVSRFPSRLQTASGRVPVDNETSAPWKETWMQRRRPREGAAMPHVATKSAVIVFLSFHNI